MNDLALDPKTGDLAIVGFELHIVQGADAVRQQLDLKLTLWTGAWFLDTEFGTPYLDNVLGKQVSLNGAVSALKKSILEVQDVDKITKFNFAVDRQQRKISVSFECATSYGLIRIST